MGKGKPRKPISSMDKRRKGAIITKKAEKKEEKRASFHNLDPSLIKRAAKTVKNMDVVTPYVIATSLNIKMSLARNVIRELIRSGELQLIDKGRSVIIAVPTKK
jgi:ribosomal protein S25